MQRSDTTQEMVQLPGPEACAEQMEKKKSPRRWLEAGRQVFPIYLATHLVFLCLTYLATLFQLSNFSGATLHLRTLLNSWNRWDSGLFTGIALHGYQGAWQTAFFPLFPLSERTLTAVIHDPFIAGLVVANVATYGMFMVLYRLVDEDFDEERAWRSVLYLAIFPSAFFFAAAYNESLFLFLSLLSFYHMRRGHWWLAGLAALFAGLTRSIAVCLFIPFCYEYARQHAFQLRRVQLDAVSGVGIFEGVAIFALYGYLRFHDLLAFSHAQLMRSWDRELRWPWLVFWEGYGILRQHGLLTFDAIHTAMDLCALVFVLVLLVLAFLGPWKLRREQRSYALYGATIYLFCILFPEGGRYPLASLARFMLEIFPAFVVLAAAGQRRTVHMYYMSLALPLLAFMLLQWLTGGWIV